MATYQGKNAFCSLCCNIFSDPVMLNCGHVFCRYCIEFVLNTVKGNEGYTCPECGHKFKRRPVFYIGKNLQTEQYASQKPSLGEPKNASNDALYHGRRNSTLELPNNVTPRSEVHDVHHGTHHQWNSYHSVCIPCYLSKFTEDNGMYKLPDQEDLKLQNILWELGLITEKIFLNAHTASRNIKVSKCQQMAAYSDIEVTQFPSSERFSFSQILSLNSFSAGLHFFVVEVGCRGHWAVGLAYDSIPRRGEKSYIGCNDKSWSLEWDNEYLSVSYNSESIVISTDELVRKIGIYLNYSSGQISFFEMSGSTRHLYTFTATFTEPLHVGFYVFEKSWIKLGS